MRSLGQVLYNFHWIVRGEAARSAQAYAGFLGPFLSANGIKSIINLRGENQRFAWWRYETRVCAARGIAHIDAKLNSRKLPTRQMLVDLINAFDTAPRPFLIKCSGGQDRTSLAAALYLIKRDGWDAQAKAQAQFSRWPYLHFPKEHQHWLKQFPAYAREASEGGPIAQWIAQSYDPVHFKSWLEMMGQGGSFRHIYDAAP
ncbi:MAG TPA: hypothetical protein VHW02_15015 [Rhizomicrobium sp.]|jgi:hypothetical protein|nr:hypothetical protein [Rhizomicrobium sp.]